MTLQLETSVKGQRPLLVQDGTLYYSRGYRVYKQAGDGPAELAARFNPPMASRLKIMSPYLTKLFREGFHDLIAQPDGGLVGIVRKRIVYAAPGSGRFRAVLDIPRGSRPLGLCAFPDGSVYFGEYFSNGPRFKTDPKLAEATGQPFPREPVHIYGSDDGQSWRIVFTFPADTIRHIHGIFHDPYRDCAWILTGDFATFLRFRRIRAAERLRCR